MGIFASIYDSDAGRDPLSVFTQAKRVFVVNAAGPFERELGEPAVMIVPAPGLAGCARAVPVNDAGQPIPGTMKGYSYIASSDSRFSELVSAVCGAPFYGAVALHDRLER